MLQTKSKTLTKETTLIIEEKDVELLLDLLNKFKKTGENEATIEDEVGNTTKIVILQLKA